MKTTRTLLLILIAAISLAGLNAEVRAQDDTPTTPTTPAATDTPAAPTTPATPVDDAPVLTEGDRTGGETSKGSDDGNGDTSESKDSDKPVKPKDQQTPPLFNMQFILMIGAMVLIFVWMGKSRRKKDADRRNEMLAAMKKGDKVVTIGGIIGTFLEERNEEIVIKIDESTNTRMRFLKTAVRGVGPEAKKEESEDKK